jgi:hypothetical protein
VPTAPRWHPHSTTDGGRRTGHVGFSGGTLVTGSRPLRRNLGRKSVALEQQQRARRPAVCKGFRWWRGQDLNLRPSGYEIDSHLSSPSLPVPFSTCELEFLISGVPNRTSASRPIPALPVENPVEEPRSMASIRMTGSRCFAVATLLPSSNLRRSSRSASAVTLGFPSRASTWLPSKGAESSLRPAIGCAGRSRRGWVGRRRLLCQRGRRASSRRSAYPGRGIKA